MPSGPKTTWEDLSNLGWSIQNIYNKANDTRGHTMKKIEDLYLNDGIAAKYQWWSYNITKGSPYLKGNNTSSVDSDETVWSYDNTKNTEPFTTSWMESWTESSTATLSVTSSASISLSQSITIPEVGGSEFTLTISTEDNKAQTKENSHQLSNTWDITVAPGEKVDIIRTITTSTGTAQYGQNYGVTDTSLFGTNGTEYNGHHYWAYYINGLLNSPTGTMVLSGFSVTTQYHYQLVREGPDGEKRKETLPRPSVMHEIIGDQRREILLMVHGDE
ncbi:TEER-decreasing protein [Fomitiporia mediterranea MF3/22]|uniref:TEER-decreasing protein n=1 Tax=Fomitiporia mediterranea (strain MF3/22) TaxID=694068 RepID=UPI000440786F|nr:TEER-decreasing protein [Fomitiporia mediterranea MF3/22]EJC99829.1 TEER-decreasing protein [Fomitiporia mediterranea MF3/22]